MSQPPRNTHANGIDPASSGNAALQPSTLLGNAGPQLDIDINQPGKQHGHLMLPQHGHTGAPHQLRIPVCVIRGEQPGPTVTILAGIHGDECEGSIIAHRLARELTAEQIQGCLILLPCVNTFGQASGVRHNPSDQMNIDYAFPGDAQGSPSENLAHHITQLFIVPSDSVLDLRSGGRYLKFIPSVAVRFDAGKKKPSRAEDAMISFGAPNSLRLPASSTGSCLQGMVAQMGKDYLQTELGGGGAYDIQTLSLAYTGCLNTLRSLGVLDIDLTLASTRLLEVRDDSYYIYSPDYGLFEPLSYLGESVWKDTPLARLISPTSSASDPLQIDAPRNATLIACHPGGVVNAGDLIAILADEVQA